MSAYKAKKTGKWFAKFYYENWKGERQQKWKGNFGIKNEALEFEKNFLEQQAGSPDMLLENLYAVYTEDEGCRLKLSTMEHKRSIYETRILPYLGKKFLNEIKATDIRKWQNTMMRNGYSQTYPKDINDQLRCLLNYAMLFYDLNTDPADKAGSIGKATSDEMNFWNLDEYLTFREPIKDKPVSYLAFENLYWTGIRVIRESDRMVLVN